MQFKPIIVIRDGPSKKVTSMLNENIARVQNCPDIVISNSLVGFRLCLFDITLIKCLKGLKSQKSLFVSLDHSTCPKNANFSE